MNADRSFKMKMREVENAFRHRRIPYPKRSIEIITLLAISCTLFLFFHTNKLNSRIKEMEEKLQPSEFTALGLTSLKHFDSKNGKKYSDVNTLQGTYQYLKSTGQLYAFNASKLNNTKKSTTDKLFFNRLEKVGSQSMSALLIELAKINSFVPYRNAPLASTPLIAHPEDQLQIASEITEVEETLSYVEHINWINFTQFDMPKPIYMNLIRHPIEKVISAYYYMRQPEVFAFYLKNGARKVESKKYFRTSFNDCVREGIIEECIFAPHIQYNLDWRRFSLHFCGHLPVCKEFNSQTASQIAMRNIEQEYAVVGTWEDTNITLTVLEHYIPRFFREATKIFYSNPKKFHLNSSPHKSELDPDIEAKLKIQFAFEIEVYNFAKQRLYKQYIAVKKDDVEKKFERNYLKWPILHK